MTTNSSLRNEINLNSKIIFDDLNKTVTKSYNDNFTGHLDLNVKKNFIYTAIKLDTKIYQDCIILMMNYFKFLWNILAKIIQVK